ncbi:MAG: metallophosphoesterase family protein [Promethearchaeota archaeon]|nr:MAG: metallophosphoesterase family protein [Candidatus Lokiarchaeota archaeon]
MKSHCIWLGKILFSLLILSPLPLFLLIDDSLQNHSPTEKAPYVHWGGLDPHSEIYISWETEHPTGSYIQYGPDVENLEFSYNNISETFLHHGKLLSLAADTRYYYQIVDTEGHPQSVVQTFKTAPLPGTSFNITLIADTQQAMGIGHYETTAKSLANLQDTDFVIDAGDICQVPDDQKTWDYFFQLSAKYTSKFPLITVPGNHDGDDVNGLYTDYFTQSHPNGRYYAFNWSNVQFVMAEIADGGDVPKGVPSNDAHYAWLNETLEQGLAQDYRVLVLHRSVLFSIGEDEDLKKNLIPVIEKYNVSLVIYGHTHCYERFYFQNHTYLCLGGGAGLQNSIMRTSEYSQIQALGPFYSQLEFSPSGIVLTTVSSLGDIIDRVEFLKEGSQLIPLVSESGPNGGM